MEYGIYYYDLWGNKKEGFEVNNVFSFGKTITLEDGATDEEIIQELRNCGFLNPNLPTKNFVIEGEYEYTLYINYNSRRMGYCRPICELRRVEEK